MSLVYITRHNENIADIEKGPPTLAEVRFAQRPTSRYESKYKKIIKEKAKTDSKSVAQLKETIKFEHETKLCTKMQAGAQPCKQICRNASTLMLPTHSFALKKVEPRKKDLAQIPLNESNRRAQTAPPQQYLTQFVDSPNGHTTSLYGSGLIPQYVNTKKYGQVPHYLRQRKQTLKRDREIKEKLEKEQHQGFMHAGIKPIAKEEHANILAGLQANYLQKLKAYQSLPLCIDTVNRKQRKTKMENELRQLELDIDLIKNHSMIYIS